MFPLRTTWSAWMNNFTAKIILDHKHLLKILTQSMLRKLLHLKFHPYPGVFERLASMSSSFDQWERATKSWSVTYTGSGSSLQFDSLSIQTFKTIHIIIGSQRLEVCQTGVLCCSPCCSVSLWDGACRWIRIQVGCVCSVLAPWQNHKQWLQVLLLSCWRFQLFNEFLFNSYKARRLMSACNVRACVCPRKRQTNRFSNVCLSRSWQTAHVWWLWSPETLARGDLQHPCSGMVRTAALAWKVLVFNLCLWTKHKVPASN